MQHIILQLVIVHVHKLETDVFMFRASREKFLFASVERKQWLSPSIGSIFKILNDRIPSLMFIELYDYHQIR